MYFNIFIVIKFLNCSQLYPNIRNGLEITNQLFIEKNNSLNVDNNNLYKPAFTFIFNSLNTGDNKEWNFVQKDNEVLIYCNKLDDEKNDFQEIFFVGMLLENKTDKFFIGKFEKRCFIHDLNQQS